MLVEPEKPKDASVDMLNVSDADRDALRRLVDEFATMAAEPVHQERAERWRRCNDLKATRPPVWITELPWHELGTDEEMACQCEDGWARDMEWTFRRILYRLKHFPGDSIVYPELECARVINSTGFGLSADDDVAVTDSENSIVSHHYNRVISEPEDIEKIQMPVVTYDDEATQKKHQAMVDLFGDILPVKLVGRRHIWFTPWDYLIQWWGVEEAMLDLVMRPDMVHAAVDRMVDGWMAELDQFVEMNLLSLDALNCRVGSGGYGYSSELPGDDYDPDAVKPHNMWGCSNSQIFAAVSPEMHWEFAIEHDLRWLERWGMTYYGCCEPLDGKMDMLRRIANLRKISVSPWCDSRRAVEQMGADYVMSRKPNPAILAEGEWRPDQARRELVEFMEATDRRCHVELIMKDISTVRYQPRRLWEWSRIAMEVAEDFAG